jgi:hypothetical protein
MDSVSYYGDTLRIYEAGSGTPFEAEIIGGGGNGIIDALPNGTVQINAEGNALIIENSIFITVADSLVYANLGLAGLLPGDVSYSFVSAPFEGLGLAVAASTDSSNAFVGPLLYDESEGSAVAMVWRIENTDSTEVRVNERGINLIADTLDATGVTTFLGFPGGTDSQTLSTSNDTLTISGGNSVKLPGTLYVRDSVTTTTLTIDLKESNSAFVSIRMTSAINLTLTINNAFGELTDATAPTYEGWTGIYTFRFWDVSGTDNVTWPAAFCDMNGTALGTDALTSGTAYTCQYDPVEAKFFCK